MRADHVISMRADLDDGAIRCHVGAGDLFCWDSRVMHGNGPGDEDAAALAELQAAPPQLMRASVYTCMAPRSHASEETLIQRRRSVAEGVGSGAWCAHPFSNDGIWQENDVEKRLREAGGRRAPLPGDGWELSPFQQSLVG